MSHSTDPAALFCEKNCRGPTAAEHTACRVERYGYECIRGILAHLRQVYGHDGRPCIAPRLLSCEHLRSCNTCALPVGTVCAKPDGDPP